jgi:hypothetical protein
VSISIFIREANMLGYIIKEDGRVLSLAITDGLRFPNIGAAKEAFQRIPVQNLAGERWEMVAADPERSTEEVDIHPVGELEVLEEVKPAPLRGAVELFAMLKKSSKYYHQFRGWAKVDSVFSPSHGDEYCFRCAHNSYRHADLIFGVKLANGEIVRLDKWVPTKRERTVAA